MTFGIFIAIFLSAVSLSADAFAVSICDGMVYRDLNKRKGVLIPATFGLFQALMPIIGYYVYKLFNTLEVFSKFDHWVAFVLLIFIGGKMIFDGTEELRSPDEIVNFKKFSVTELLIQGVATSIDALAVGFSLGQLLNGVTGSIDLWAWVSVGIIGITTFTLAFIGLIIGIKVGQLFKKKASVAEIIGGLVLIAIALKIVIESYL